MMVNFRTAIDKVKEVIHGPIIVTTKGNGWQIKWMVKEFTQMHKSNFKDILKTIISYARCNDSYKFIILAINIHIIIDHFTYKKLIKLNKWWKYNEKAL